MILGGKNIQPDARALALLLNVTSLGGCTRCPATHNIFGVEGAGANINPAGGARYNVGFGYHALNAMTTGDYNVGIGYYAGATLTTAGENVFIGDTAGYRCNSYYNVMIGYGAGYGLAASYSGSENVFMGQDAGYNIDTGDDNTGVGYGALQGNAVTGIDGSYNCAFGVGSLSSISTGESNVALGGNAGNLITTGSYNIMIGDGVASSAVGANREVNIGDLIYGETDNDNMGLNTRSYSGGQGVLAIHNASTNPAGGAANTAMFYVSAGEMWVLDSAGNPTQLSPHVNGEWVHREKRNGKDYIVYLERLVREFEKMTGKKFSEVLNA